VTNPTRELADDLLRELLSLTRPACERCGRPRTEPRSLDVAHILRRRYSVTRCRPENVWALCRGCHQTVDADPDEHTRLVARTITVQRFLSMRGDAVRGLDMPADIWWQLEVARLRSEIATARARLADAPVEYAP
jgi:hypothetical protein